MDCEHHFRKPPASRRRKLRQAGCFSTLLGALFLMTEYNGVCGTAVALQAEALCRRENPPGIYAACGGPAAARLVVVAAKSSVILDIKKNAVFSSRSLRVASMHVFSENHICVSSLRYYCRRNIQLLAAPKGTLMK